MNATKQQIRAINATLVKKGLMDDKKALISSFTKGRCHSCSNLSIDEAKALLRLLNRDTNPSGSDIRKQKMERKILAMAHEMGWIKKQLIITDEGIKIHPNYESFNDWMSKFSYLKKPLPQYSYLELPKLVTQFENGPYKAYFNKL